MNFFETIIYQITIPILTIVNRESDKILSLFLEIPTKNVQSLYEATENYIQELRRDNDEKNSVGDN